VRADIICCEYGVINLVERDAPVADLEAQRLTFRQFRGGA
jgi:hypothetical protein